MIPLAHIAPIDLTSFCEARSDMNMVLAHIADKSKQYASVFKSSVKYTLLDNGAFENGVPFDVERMIDIGKRVGADTLVLPDYPGRDWTDGWKDVDADIKRYKDAGFATMFVPQSVYGDSQGYLLSLYNAVKNPYIDFIGLSILGAPTAFPSMPTHDIRRFILDRAVARFSFDKLANRFHMLGMIDAGQEIANLKNYSAIISGWDTSAAAWAGLHNRDISMHTTKFGKPVCFEAPADGDSASLIEKNIDYLKGLR